MILLDGKAVSEARLTDLKHKMEEHYLKTRKRPGLAVLRVGEDPASKIYVRKKIQTCERVGIHSLERHFPETTSEKELLEVIRDFNRDSDIHGILVQLPLPKQILTDRILEEVDPKKDVDGFHPMNLGKLVINQDGLRACTPLGLMNLLSEYKIDVYGKRAVVVGRSRIVGRPMSLLLDLAGATVTVVHTETKNPDEITRSADILVVAAGKPHLIQGSQIKEGAVVVDVGIHRASSGEIVGDVHACSVEKKACAMTPVPGGVGPMTICSLLENTWKAFQQI